MKLQSTKLPKNTVASRYQMGSDLVSQIANLGVHKTDVTKAATQENRATVGWSKRRIRIKHRSFRLVARH
jgi:hypothetical protein